MHRNIWKEDAGLADEARHTPRFRELYKRWRETFKRVLRFFGKWRFAENGDLGLDNPKSSGIIITLSHLAAFLNHTDFLELLWRSRLVGRGRMIGNHVGP